MPMQFDYDEIGDMFTYFMISFGALILTPGMVQLYGFWENSFFEKFNFLNVNIISFEPKKLQFINGAVVQLAKNSPVWISFETDTETQNGSPKK